MSLDSIRSVAIVGLGLIGSSIARAVREALPAVRLIGHDREADVRERARSLALVDTLLDEPGPELGAADLVILCVPVGEMAAAAQALRGTLGAATIVSDVGSSKESVAADLRRLLPDGRLVPAHPVAGTENSGPEAGFAALFRGRWCILTPDDQAEPQDIETVAGFWQALGARTEVMDARHHDLVLAVTSHLPHLIAFTIVGTASDLEAVTRSEVIKFSAGGFRDFTRIAASNPVMWRDIFLANKTAVLDTLQRFSEDLTVLQRAIRRDDGETLYQLFSRTSAIRRGIVEQGQDVALPDFGRSAPAIATKPTTEDQ